MPNRIKSLQTTESRVAIGNHIRRQRTKLNWSKKELAERLEVSPNTIRRWEEGESSMTMANLNALRFVLNIDESEIIILLGSNTLNALRDRLTNPQQEPAPSHPPSHIGNLICAYRELRELTQADLATRMGGIKPARVWGWEQGRNVPGGHTLALLQRALDMPAQAMLDALYKDAVSHKTNPST